MFGLFRKSYIHRYTDTHEKTEGDMVLEDIRKAFKFKDYSGNCLTTYSTKKGTLVASKVLIRDGGYILIKDRIGWTTPEPLSRTGLRGVYHYPSKTTYLYSVGDNIMTEIRNGRVLREWIPYPNRKLSYWVTLDDYIARL